MPEFTASYDTTTKVISGLICVMLFGLGLVVHFTVVQALFMLLVLGSYAYSPRSYAISGDALVIKRLIRNIRIPLDSIREVRPGTRDDLTGGIRLWGSGGMFGYYGLFNTGSLGKSTWYVTDRSRTVIVRTATKTLVLSPDDVQGFLGALKATPGQVLPGGTQPPLRADRISTLIGVGIGVLVAAFVAGALLYSPAPPEYTLAAGSLTIHDRFYPVTLKVDDIDAGQVRIVDLAQEPEWRPTLRSNGFANAHYQSGWFHTANGKRVRVYRAGGSRLVLIPPKGKGNSILYQAKDPERFIADLRQAAGRGAS
jgi:hypothetical protein